MTVERRAAERARELVRACGRDAARLALVYHGDADGISSAALVRASAERLGANVSALTPRKGTNVYDARFRRAVDEQRANACVVLDTGARPGVAWRSSPTVIVDHHPTASAPDVEAFVHDDSAISTSLITASVFAPLVDVADRAWLAAIGALGDAGDAARANPVVAEAAKRFGVTALREIVALVNAAGRASTPANDVAYEALSRARDPRALLGEAGELREMRREVSDALARARRVGPKVRGRWALIEIRETCRIHGVLASTWARRLRPKIVLVANLGYVAGRVHLSVRADGDVNLREALRELLPDEGDDYAAGHTRASGAIIDVATYERLLDAIDREQRA